MSFNRDPDSYLSGSVPNFRDSGDIVEDGDLCSFRDNFQQCDYMSDLEESHLQDERQGSTSCFNVLSSNDIFEGSEMNTDELEKVVLKISGRYSKTMYSYVLFSSCDIIFEMLLRGVLQRPIEDSVKLWFPSPEALLRNYTSEVEAKKFLVNKFGDDRGAIVGDILGQLLADYDGKTNTVVSPTMTQMEGNICGTQCNISSHYIPLRSHIPRLVGVNADKSLDRVLSPIIRAVTRYRLNADYWVPLLRVAAFYAGDNPLSAAHFIDITRGVLEGRIGGIDNAVVSALSPYMRGMRDNNIDRVGTGVPHRALILSDLYLSAAMEFGSTLLLHYSQLLSRKFAFPTTFEILQNTNLVLHRDFRRRLEWTMRATGDIGKEAVEWEREYFPVLFKDRELQVKAIAKLARGTPEERQVDSATRTRDCDGGVSTELMMNFSKEGHMSNIDGKKPLKLRQASSILNANTFSYPSSTSGSYISSTDLFYLLPDRYGSTTATLNDQIYQQALRDSQQGSVFHQGSLFSSTSSPSSTMFQESIGDNDTEDLYTVSSDRNTYTIPNEYVNEGKFDVNDLEDTSQESGNPSTEISQPLYRISLIGEMDEESEFENGVKKCSGYFGELLSIFKSSGDEEDKSEEMIEEQFQIMRECKENEQSSILFSGHFQQKHLNSKSSKGKFSSTHNTLYLNNSFLRDNTRLKDDVTEGIHDQCKILKQLRKRADKTKDTVSLSKKRKKNTV